MALLVRLTLLAALLLSVHTAPAAAARSCPSPQKAIAQLKVSRASCATARRIAKQAAAIRHDARRYERARRCRADFCIVVRGWRCTPARSAQPRERCVRRRSAITWLWRN